MKFREFWNIWAKALGPKADNNSKIADKVAIVRTIILIIYVVTNICIIAGIWRHW